jgi:hypothetical protein
VVERRVAIINRSKSASTMHRCRNVVATVDSSSTKYGLNGKRAGRDSAKNALKPVAGWKSTRLAKRDGMPVCFVGRKKNGRTSERVAAADSHNFVS